MADKYIKITSVLNEKDRRLALADKAKSYGRRGLSEVSRLSGLSRVTINAGLKELDKNLSTLLPKSKKDKKVVAGKRKQSKILAYQKTLKIL